MSQPKTAVYMATRRKYWYEKVQPSINSMLANSPGIDRIVILCEDDVFPYKLPDKVETINVLHQKWFAPDSINMIQNNWGYMVLLKAALSKLFPECDKVLSIDADTIVWMDLSHLWDADMDGYYVAGVKEPEKSRIYDRNYINAGMCFWNLAEMRKDGADDKYIDQLNKKHYVYKEQDALSELFHAKIRLLDGAYNMTPYTVLPTEPVRVMHFAAYKEWYEESEFVKEWKKPWREI